MLAAFNFNLKDIWRAVNVSSGKAITYKVHTYLVEPEAHGDSHSGLRSCFLSAKCYRIKLSEGRSYHFKD